MNGRHITGDTKYHKGSYFIFFVEIYFHQFSLKKIDEVLAQLIFFSKCFTKNYVNLVRKIQFS